VPSAVAFLAFKVPINIRRAVWFIAFLPLMRYSCSDVYITWQTNRFGAKGASPFTDDHFDLTNIMAIAAALFRVRESAPSASGEYRHTNLEQLTQPGAISRNGWKTPFSALKTPTAERHQFYTGTHARQGNPLADTIISACKYRTRPQKGRRAFTGAGAPTSFEGNLWYTTWSSWRLFAGDILPPARARGDE